MTGFVLGQAATGDSGVNYLALLVFAVLVAVTLGVTYWASSRTSNATDFWAAGRGISARQNGFAMAGEWLSASSLLGYAGLTFIFGFDGVIFAVCSVVSSVLLLFILAGRMRNVGTYTMSDVLAFRLKERPIRIAASIGTLSVALLYLCTQLVAAGVLFAALSGVDFTLGVIIAGAFVLVYVTFGGMLATTWVQIIKAALLMVAIGLVTILLLNRFAWNPSEIFVQAVENSQAGPAYLRPGLLLQDGWDLASLAIVGIFAGLGLPHVLMRFFTVPDARTARKSMGWAVGLLSVFYIMLIIDAVGARAVLTPAESEATGAGGNLALPLLAQVLGGGEGTLGGDLLLAFISAAAFSTVLAVTAGLLISASGAVAHDLWSRSIRHSVNSEREEPVVGRIAAVVLAVAAMGIAIAIGDQYNIGYLVILTLSIAVSANLPALVLALFWRRLSTVGAVCGVIVGLVSSLALIVLSPSVYGEGAPWPLDYPVLVSVPLGFLTCWLGSMARPDRDASRYAELRVRSETGVGANAPASHDAEPSRTIPTALSGDNRVGD